MAGSTLSLESLSSPSPSPSPQPGTSKLSEPNNAGLNSDSELSELTEEEQERDKLHNSPRKNQSNGISRRGGHPSRRGIRRKTNSIVPAPMWGWAETKSSNVLEEEEEEEFRSPPRAMEEEEDEEPRDDEEDELALCKGPDGADDDPTDEEDDLPTINGNDGKYFAPMNDDRHFSRSFEKVASLEPSAPSEGDGGAEDDHSVTHQEDNHTAIEPGENSDAGLLRTHLESENETDDDDEQVAENDSTFALDSVPVSALPTPSPEAPLDIDESVNQLSLFNVTSVSTITVPTTSVHPSSPTHSSQSPISTRSPSPDIGSDPDEALRAGVMRGVAPEPSCKVGDVIHAGIIVAPTAADVDVMEPDAVDEQDQIQDQGRVPEQDIDAEDDLDVEVESDLQPAYRAEALDVLATIELKFALLRERVYVEKMEDLAWEESLISNGEMHPELTHLQNELASRRDRRLQLASRKRSFEIENARKRRRGDEDAIWSWWKSARDELQTDMIAETNRKRRRMEREKRASDRPQPLRRIPPAPQEIPPVPSLRKLIKTLYGCKKTNVSTSRRQTRQHRLRRGFCHDSATSTHRKLIYPELPTLSLMEITCDLDFLYQARLEREHSQGFVASYDGHLHHYQYSRPTGMTTDPGVVSGSGLQHGDVPTVIVPSQPINYGAGEGHRVNLVPFAQHQQQHPHQFLGHLHHQPQTLPPQSLGVPVSGSLIPSTSSHTPLPLTDPSGSKNIHVHSQQQIPQPSLYVSRNELVPVTEHRQHRHQNPQLHLSPSSNSQQELAGSSGHASYPHHLCMETGGPYPQSQDSRRSVSPSNLNNSLPNGKLNGSWNTHPKGGNIIREESSSGERDRREKERRDETSQLGERDLEVEREPYRGRDQHGQQTRHGVPSTHHHPHIGVLPHHHHGRHVHVVHHHHQPRSPPDAPGGAHIPLPAGPLSSQSGNTYHERERDFEAFSRSQRGHSQHPTELIHLTSAKVSPKLQPWRADVNGGTTSGRGQLQQCPSSSSMSQQPSRQNSTGILSPSRSAVGGSCHDTNHPLPSLSPPTGSLPASLDPYMNRSPNRSPSRYPTTSFQGQQRSMTPSLGSVNANRPSPVGMKMSQSTPLASGILSGQLSYSSTGLYCSPRLSGPGKTSVPTESPGFESVGGKVKVAGSNVDLDEGTSPSSDFSPLPPPAAFCYASSARSHVSSTTTANGSNGLSVIHGGFDGNREREHTLEQDRDGTHRDRWGQERDVERHGISPHPGTIPQAKMSVPQMVEGH